MEIRVGDWVQAAEKVVEENFMGERVWTHARKGGIGHVEEVDTESATVYWERTGTICTVFKDELIWLCHAETGRGV